MNYQLAYQLAIVTVLALFAHAFVGIRESLSVEPAKLTDKELKELAPAIYILAPLTIFDYGVAFVFPYSETINFMWGVGIIVYFFYFFIHLINSKKICPSCKEYRAGILQSMETNLIGTSAVEYDKLWKCNKCGYEWHVKSVHLSE